MYKKDLTLNNQQMLMSQKNTSIKITYLWGGFGIK